VQPRALPTTLRRWPVPRPDWVSAPDRAAQCGTVGRHRWHLEVVVASRPAAASVPWLCRTLSECRCAPDGMGSWCASTSSPKRTVHRGNDREVMLIRSLSAARPDRLHRVVALAGGHQNHASRWLTPAARRCLSTIRSHPSRLPIPGSRSERHPRCSGKPKGRGGGTA
jgi:hypothetical protein